MKPVFFLFASLVCVSCGTPAPAPDPVPTVDAGTDAGGRPVGADCAGDADCASGACLASDSVCTATCASDADCAAGPGGRTLVCGIAACAAPEGCQMCVPACGSSHYTCVDGVSTDCSIASDPTHCIDCGCVDARNHCVRDVGCLPPAPVGESCKLDRDCASRNCSTFAGVCRVAVGTACSTANCDICLHTPTGVTHCSRECRTSTDCRGEACVGSTALLLFECRPTDCAGGVCTAERAPHETGQACRADTDCRSGACFATARCSGTECTADGWCTEACTAEADCRAGTHCVHVPCAAGQTSACGDVCLHACAEFVDCGVYGGTCSALVTPDRMLESVCDVRRPDGRSCAADRECLSASCVSGTCAP